MTEPVFANFNTKEASIVRAIVKRAQALAPDQKIDSLSLTMDISATHAQHPLRLTDLLEADKVNFVHDVFGIRRHMNRETGKLENHFIPRFTV